MEAFVFFNCDSLHARLNSHYEAWSYKKKKHKKIRAHRATSGERNFIEQIKAPIFLEAVLAIEIM